MMKAYVSWSNVTSANRLSAKRKTNKNFCIVTKIMAWKWTTVRLTSANTTSSKNLLGSKWSLTFLSKSGNTSRLCSTSCFVHLTMLVKASSSVLHWVEKCIEMINAAANCTATMNHWRRNRKAVQVYSENVLDLCVFATTHSQVIKTQALTRFSSDEMIDWTSSWSNSMNSGWFRMAYLLEDTKVGEAVAIAVSLQVLAAFLKL